jgi:hypothetical protein
VLDPPVPAALTDENLAAPHGPIMTQPNAVERYPHHRSPEIVLGDHAGDVGVVMLNPDRLTPVRQPLGDPRRGVVGVEVAGDPAW